VLLAYVGTAAPGTSWRTCTASSSAAPSGGSKHFSIPSRDVVILDTPPLLAASDAAILGAGADGVTLVVRAGQTDRGAAREAIQQLDLLGARVIGPVLDDPDATVQSYGG
jgi:Mrp family chromosome partitioning ATPase